MCLLRLLLNLKVFSAKIVYRFRRYFTYILSLIFVFKLTNKFAAIGLQIRRLSAQYEFLSQTVPFLILF